MKKSLKCLTFSAALAACALEMTGCQTTVETVYGPPEDYVLSGEMSQSQGATSTGGESSSVQGATSTGGESSSAQSADPAVDESSAAQSSAEDISSVMEFDASSNYLVDVYGPPEDFGLYGDGSMRDLEPDFEPDLNIQQPTYGPPADYQAISAPGAYLPTGTVEQEESGDA